MFISYFIISHHRATNEPLQVFAVIEKASSRQWAVKLYTDVLMTIPFDLNQLEKDEYWFEYGIGLKQSAKNASKLFKRIYFSLNNDYAMSGFDNWLMRTRTF